MHTQNISPLDGRYKEQLIDLRNIFSEFNLMRTRLRVEIEWLKTIKKISKPAQKFLDGLVNNFNDKEIKQIKKFERETNHDVKAVEYFLRAKIAKHKELSKYSEFIHFGCTSEDINNLAYALMIKSAHEQVLLPIMLELINKLTALAKQNASVPMLARTHGQPATPTTVGKEFANFVVRFKRQYNQLKKAEIMGKMNGAVGNFNAHYAAYPEINWLKLSRNFVTELGLTWNSHTTQIEPHDYIAELCDIMARFNTILIGLDRDIWGYISLNYFKQKIKANEVGSSTMPHKVNPIDFENSEGNLGIANALYKHFAEKLPISRWQRDLTDSTVLRNIGVAFAHSILAYKSTLKGLNKLEINRELLSYDLQQHPEVLAEALQTMMRRYGIEKPYEQLKTLTRGQKITQEILRNFINELPLPTAAKKQFSQLTPSDYLGIATKLARKI